jgi:hypothetical protein
MIMSILFARTAFFPSSLVIVDLSDGGESGCSSSKALITVDSLIKSRVPACRCCRQVSKAKSRNYVSRQRTVPEGGLPVRALIARAAASTVVLLFS